MWASYVNERLRWTPDRGGARLGLIAENPWASVNLACNEGSLSLGYQSTLSLEAAGC